MSLSQERPPLYLTNPLLWEVRLRLPSVPNDIRPTGEFIYLVLPLFPKEKEGVVNF